MKELIQNLIKEISELTVPIDFKLLKAKFAMFPTLKTEVIPAELAAIVEQLLALEKSVDEGLTVSFNQFRIQEAKQLVASKTPDLQKNSQTLAEVNKQITTQRQILNGIYQDLMNLVTNDQADKDTIPDLETQALHVAESQVAIKKALKPLNTPQARLDAAILEVQINTLLEELNPLGVIPSKIYINGRFENLILNVNLTIKDLEKFKIEINALSDKLKSSFYKLELTTKIDDFNRDLNSIVHEEEANNKLISTNKLSEDKRKQLTTEFDAHANKEVLIASHYKKIDGITSYASMASWTNYFTNTQYKEEQEILRCSVEFLNLLVAKETLSIEHTKYSAMLAQLNAILNDPKNMEAPHLLSNALKMESAELFKRCGALLTPPPFSSPTGPDYYLALQENIPLIEQNILRKNAALEKLMELVLLDKKLISIMTEYELPFDEYAETPKLDQLKAEVDKSATDNGAQHDRLTRQLALCTIFSQDMGILNGLKNQEQDLRKSINEAIPDLNMKENIIKEFDEEQLASSILAFQSTIAKQIAAIKTFAPFSQPSVPTIETRPLEIVCSPITSNSPPSAIPASAPSPLKVTAKAAAPINPDITAPTAPGPVSTTINNPTTTENVKPAVVVVAVVEDHPLSAAPEAPAIVKELEKPVKSPNKEAPVSAQVQRMLDWHNEILVVIKDYPEDMQKWYTQVFNALNILAIPNNASSDRQSHVIRDILFELKDKESRNTLRAYMRLCPKPETDINKLLQLKPNLSIPNQTFDETEFFKDCPVELKPLQSQYNHLKKSHPFEAELLLQAICSFKAAKGYLAIPSFISVEHFPPISKDPRYEPLKRHRGILQAWEALEDLCRWIIGKISKQAEYEYSNRPCFFNTRSGKLFTEADQMIQSNLPRSSNNA